jgi:hypothetical protein
LSMWAETAAGLAAVLEQPSLAQALMTAVRQMTVSHDQLAVVRRWRDAHFGPAPAWTAVSADEKQSLREGLRRAVQHFNHSVRETTAA